MRASSYPGLALSLVLALTACGKDSGGNAALGRSFNYGSPQAPTQDESAAASSAQSTTGSAASFSSSPNATQGLAITSMASSLGNQLLGDSSLASPTSGTIVAEKVRMYDLATCATATATSVTFTNCVVDDGGYSLTMNGSIAASAGVVTWDLTGAFAGAILGVTFDITTHPAGNITVSGSKITGTSTDELKGSVSGNGQSYKFGVDHAILLDLTYQSAPTACITAGTLEVKRVWTEKPSGASGAAFSDAAVKLTWTGCGTVTVAHGT